jgi:hypothetical protein
MGVVFLALLALSTARFSGVFAHHPYQNCGPCLARQGGALVRSETLLFSGSASTRANFEQMIDSEDGFWDFYFPGGSPQLPQAMHGSWIEFQAAGFVTLAFLKEGSGTRDAFGVFEFTQQGAGTPPVVVREQLVFPDTATAYCDLKRYDAVTLGPYAQGTRLGFLAIPNGRCNNQTRPVYSLPELNGAAGEAKFMSITDVHTGSHVVGYRFGGDSVSPRNGVFGVIPGAGATITSSAGSLPTLCFPACRFNRATCDYAHNGTCVCHDSFFGGPVCNSCPCATLAGSCGSELSGCAPSCRAPYHGADFSTFCTYDGGTTPCCRYEKGTDCATQGASACPLKEEDESAAADNAGAVAGGVAGAVGGVAVVGGAVALVVLIRRRKNRDVENDGDLQLDSVPQTGPVTPIAPAVTPTEYSEFRPNSGSATEYSGLPTHAHASVTESVYGELAEGTGDQALDRKDKTGEYGGIAPLVEGGNEYDESSLPVAPGQDASEYDDLEQMGQDD